MFINSGIINIGDNNNNTVYNNIDYDGLLKELHILYNNAEEKQQIKEAITYVKKKDDKKLIKCFKNFSKLTINLIKQLSLKIIESYIEKYINL